MEKILERITMYTERITDLIGQLPASKKNLTAKLEDEIEKIEDLCENPPTEEDED